MPCSRRQPGTGGPLVAGWVLVAVTLCGCGGSGDSGESRGSRDSGGPGFGFELVDRGITGHFGRRGGRVFDVVAADMDLDGDPDLLINGHHIAPLELYENEGGRFTRINVRGRDATGLYDNPGIRSLYATTKEMTARIEASGAPGLHVWHDLDRRGSWRFRWKGEGGFVLELLTSVEIFEIDGLVEGEVRRESQRTMRATVADADGRTFRVRTLPSSRLHLRLRSPSGEPLPIHVGADGAPRPDGELDIWEADPHGVAWVDVEGTPAPEIYITRGGLIGKLVPPLVPKVDRYYLAGPNGPPYTQAAEGIVPRDRGRGRRVEWVDVDNDGTLELSIANEATPSRLLRRAESAGPFREERLGDELTETAVQAWGDHDGDGFQDLYFLEERTVCVLLNREGHGFERGDLALQLPPLEKPDTAQFEFGTLRLVDFDADGRLDLWVLCVGDDRTNHLFLRRGDGFEDATERVGLNALSGNIFAVLLDVDNDGYEDAISSGRLLGEPDDAGFALLWRNRGGARFDFVRVPHTVIPESVHAGAALDADGDGRTDLALVAAERFLLRNTSDTGNGFVDVELRDGEREPIGALVRIFYSDGSVVVRRHGSVRNTAYSQTLGPLRFGIPTGKTIEKLAVRWTGDREDTPYPAPPLNQLTRIER